MFSAALTAGQAAAALAALDIMETEPEIVQRLWDNAEFMRAGFKRLGFNTARSNTPIIPVVIGDDFRTVMAWHALINEGVYTNPVLPPGVPPANSLLRTSYMASHTQEHLQRALDAFAVVGDRLDLLHTPEELEAMPEGGL